MTKIEHLAYLNGYLSAVETLNTIPNCMKDFGFKEIDFIENSFENSLKTFLVTPSWNFEFKKIEENWKEILIENSSSMFNAIIVEAHGYPIDVGNEKFEELVKKHNINDVQNDFIWLLSNFLNLYDSFEVFEVYISNQFNNQLENEGYFAHGEYNVLFKTSNNELFLLYFRDSD